MVTAHSSAVMRWPSASHQPASTNQIMLPSKPSGPVPMSSRPKYSSRDTAFWPNGSLGISNPRACVDGNIYSIMHKGDPDPTQYCAVFRLVQVGDIFYEVSYGHMNDIYVEPDRTVKAGDIIGTVGNTGPVYSDGVAALPATGDLAIRDTSREI